MGKLQSQALNVAILQVLCVCGLVGGRNLQFEEEVGRSSLSFDIIDTIYQFGDSLSDTGNAIREDASSGLCTSYPYGESFFDYVTGRCSDGLVMADYYATAFGLPFLNPYLDGNANFSNGADFSVSGASALNVEVLESLDIAAGGTNSSLLVQLRWFETHLKSICTSPSGRSFVVVINGGRTTTGASTTSQLSWEDEFVGGDPKSPPVVVADSVGVTSRRQLTWEAKKGPALIFAED